MNKQEIAALYDSAERQWQSRKFLNQDIGMIDKTFQGYIAAFAGNVAAGGLLMAAAVFHSQKEAVKDRRLLADAINEMLEENQLLGEKQNRYGKSLLDTVRLTGPNWRHQAALKEKVLGCALALKHTLREFEVGQISKQKEGNE